MSKVAFFLWALLFFSALATKTGFACDPTTESDASGGSCSNSDCFTMCPPSAGHGGGFGGIQPLDLIPLAIHTIIRQKLVPDRESTQEPNLGLAIFGTKDQRASEDEREAYFDKKAGIA